MRGKWLKKPQSETTVIFVHGVLSSGETCWRHPNGTYWPTLLEGDPELGSAGVYVFTYQTGLFSGSYRLGDIVDALKEHMRLDGVFGSDRLIFVCHSMGGIVVRKFILERATQLISEEKEIGLFLAASPSLGSSYADWLSPLAELFGHAQADALRFVRDNDWLNDLDKEFNNLKEAGNLRITGKELVEDNFVFLKKLWRRQVVEPFSGARYFGEPYKIPGSDHFSIAKPENRDAIQHRLLCQFIKDMLEASRGPINEMFAPIVGHWWQYVINVEVGAVLSLMTITATKTRAPMLSGESWTADGERFAKYHSECERYDWENSTLHYSWEGDHPRQKNMPLYFGLGEITFLPFDDECATRGTGWFSTSRRSDVRDAHMKSTEYMRASADERERATSIDPDVRDSFIQEKLTYFRKLYP